jgi:hypothetical protein
MMLWGLEQLINLIEFTVANPGKKRHVLEHVSRAFLIVSTPKYTTYTLNHIESFVWNFYSVLADLKVSKCAKVFSIFIWIQKIEPGNCIQYNCVEGQLSPLVLVSNSCQHFEK